MEENENMLRGDVLWQAQVQRDSLTGLLSSGSFLSLASQCAGTESGVLALLDIDHFHLINLRCGHAQGDAMLEETAHTMRDVFGDEPLLTRLGGDCFAVFSRSLTSERMHARAAQLTSRLNKEDGRRGMRWNISFSIVVLRRREGESIEALFMRTKDLLAECKAARPKKHVASPVYNEKSVCTDLEKIRASLKEKNPPRGAIYLNHEAFKQVYRFTERRLKRADYGAFMILATLTDDEDRFPPLDTREGLMQMLGEDIRDTLRYSDIYTRSSECQYLVLVLGVRGANMGVIVGRITTRFTSRFSPDAHIALRCDLAPVGDDLLNM